MNYIHKPKEIERRSFEIINRELGEQELSADNAHIIQRVIHTTADFEYADILCFSDGAADIARRLIKRGLPVITDTRMAMAGINSNIIKRYNGVLECYISNPEVVKAAAQRQITRAMAAVDYAAQRHHEAIFVVGNAPTALYRIKELYEAGSVSPQLIIAAAVGFVNVAEAKEGIKALDIPYILTSGRKGGSTVAAAIMNAILYSIEE